MYTASNVTIPPVPPTCSTSNCSFSLYNSLSACALIANVTDLLNVTPITGNIHNGNGFNVWEYGQFQNVNLSLPNGVSMPAGEVVLKIQTLTTEVDGGTPWPVLVTNQSLAFSALPDIPASAILDFFILYQTNVAPVPITGNETAVTFAYRAIEVLFHWCVNTDSTTVTAGKATTEIVRSSRNASIDEVYFNTTVTTENDTTNYTVGNAAGNAVTQYLMTNFGNGSSTSNGGFSSQGADVLTTAVWPAVSWSGVSPAELADTDAIAMQGVQNLTTNLATSLTNSLVIFILHSLIIHSQLELIVYEQVNTMAIQQ
jgi:hypothetical protein